MESEVGTEDLNPLEQVEVRCHLHSTPSCWQARELQSNEVYFADADRADAGSVDESDVVLGDVFFIDPDGNEIIQRTTALPDGTIQTQYLGQVRSGVSDFRELRGYQKMKALIERSQHCYQ